MKNIILSLALAFFVCIGASAQATRVITGAVIDKNGNPLPGAIVEATGGAESTVVDADGTYSIEVPTWLNSLTARYSGMQTKKQKANRNEVIFRMSPERSGNYFLNLVGGVSSEEDGIHYYGQVGLMGGYLGNWGGYAKVMFTLHSIVEGVPSVTIGLTKRIKNNLHCYLGAGYTRVCGRYDGYYQYREYEDNGLMVDFGFIYNVKRINFNLGYSYSNSFCCYENHEAHIGVGYCF